MTAIVAARRGRRAKTAALAVCTLLAGCASAPLPGGAGSGGYRVSIEFLDVTDLVPYSAVKVNDVSVGQVTDIAVTGDWTAMVTVEVDDTVELPGNAVAELRQTSLLGEKFVDLAAPDDEAARGVLTDGDVIPVERTDRGAEVEEVLGALALVLQGGGLEQLRTINTELSDLMNGREDDIRDTLDEINTFVTSLDEQKDDIITALDALDQLSTDLAEQRDTIGDALDAIAPGVTELAGQQELISDAVVALGGLGDTGSEVIDRSGDETLAMLADLQPILENLVAAGDDFPQNLEQALSYPFPHNVTDDIHNDFVNLHITLDASLEGILGNLLGGKKIETPEPDKSQGFDPAAGIEPIVGGLADLLGVGLFGAVGDDSAEAGDDDSGDAVDSGDEDGE